MKNMELYCIGYAGRDKEKTLEHIQELKKIGVPEPKSIPELYHINNHLLATGKTVKVIGGETSAEVEIVLIFENDGNISVTVGSDHTDRSLETVSIHKSKQICEKPIAEKKWNLNDIIDEWEDLRLYAEVKQNGEWIKYQEGTVSAIIPLEKIQQFLREHNVESKNAIVFCGTVPLVQGFIYGDAYKCGIESKECKESIELEYEIERLKEY